MLTPTRSVACCYFSFYFCSQDSFLARDSARMLRRVVGFPKIQSNKNYNFENRFLSLKSLSASCNFQQSGELEKRVSVGARASTLILFSSRLTLTLTLFLKRTLSFFFIFCLTISRLGIEPSSNILSLHGVSLQYAAN